jgi:hypothetical protein
MSADILGQIVWAVVLIVILLFCFVVAFGAPYLPTLKPQIKEALDMLDLKPGQTLYELGSGDGRILVAAAERGIRVVGYELNPLLVIYSWAITRKYRKLVTVRWGNFWRVNLADADGIFVFLLHRYMAKLDKKIIQECRKPVKLISFAFPVQDRKADEERLGVMLYKYHPQS